MGNKYICESIPHWKEKFPMVTFFKIIKKEKFME